MPWSGHDEADPASLDRALDDLAQPVASDPGRLDACRARIAQEMAAQFRQVEGLRTSGSRDAAWALLARIEAHFDGLTAAETFDRAAKLAASPQS